MSFLSQIEQIMKKLKKKKPKTLSCYWVKRGKSEKPKFKKFKRLGYDWIFKLNLTDPLIRGKELLKVQ